MCRDQERSWWEELYLYSAVIEPRHQRRIAAQLGLVDTQSAPSGAGCMVDAIHRHRTGFSLVQFRRCQIICRNDVSDSASQDPGLYRID